MSTVNETQSVKTNFLTSVSSNYAHLCSLIILHCQSNSLESMASHQVCSKDWLVWIDLEDDLNLCWALITRGKKRHLFWSYIWVVASRYTVSYQTVHHINRMYSDRQAWANSIDPDEISQNTASHQGQHCLPLIQQFLDTILGSKLYLFKF